VIGKTVARRPRLAAVAAVLVAALIALGVWRLTSGPSYDDPFGPFGVRPAGTAQSVTRASTSGPGLEKLLSFVADDAQAFWAREFKAAGLKYVPAPVIGFERSAATPCGPATVQTGPFYCRLDHRIYLELGFFRVLAGKFHAPGDFAQAYVLAHEIGHHVQALLGVMDCLAGVWAHSTYSRGLLERGDADEALRAAAAVGDDRLQRRFGGRVNPETWTHGSAEQRRQWLARGFSSGKPSACDTFSRIL
jgi:hypothetical protein